MSNLEELVPPLELCKKIPEGKFVDSAMVYAVTKHSLNYRFGDRRYFINDYRELIPAPTLQEILDALWKFKPRVWRNKNLDPEVPAWGIALNEDNFIGHCEFVQDNPAEAALRIFLKIQEEERNGTI